jgi:hypothetical protein
MRLKSVWRVPGVATGNCLHSYSFLVSVSESDLKQLGHSLFNTALELPGLRGIQFS